MGGCSVADSSETIADIKLISCHDKRGQIHVVKRSIFKIFSHHNLNNFQI